MGVQFTRIKGRKRGVKKATVGVVVQFRKYTPLALSFRARSIGEESAPGSKRADSSRATAALRNDNFVEISKLHHYPKFGT